jgi:hypothetical protein
MGFIWVSEQTVVSFLNNIYQLVFLIMQMHCFLYGRNLIIKHLDNLWHQRVKIDLEKYAVHVKTGLKWRFYCSGLWCHHNLEQHHHLHQCENIKSLTDWTDSLRIWFCSETSWWSLWRTIRLLNNKMFLDKLMWLFYNTVSSSDYIGLNDRMNSELERIWKETVVAKFKALS